jgi:hypothetical protein
VSTCFSCPVFMANVLCVSRPSGSPRRGDRTMSVAEDPNAVLSALNASGWRGEYWALCWKYKLTAFTEMMMNVAEEDDDEEPDGR